MRQVNRDELIHTLCNSLRNITPAIWKMAMHHDATQRLKARMIMAGVQADSMARLEIMSDTNEPPVFHYPALAGSVRPKVEDTGGDAPSWWADPTKEGGWHYGEPISSPEPSPTSSGPQSERERS